MRRNSSKGGDGLPLRALHYFVELGRSDRFADAARRLNVTPSAISHQIRALEDWIGAALLDRDTKKPKLTAIGRTLHEGARVPMARIEQVMTAVRRSGDRKDLVISAPPALISFRLIPTLAGFREAHPEINVDFRLVPYDAEIDPDSSDLAIRFVHGPAEGERLGTSGWRPVCTPTYFDKLDRPSSLGDLGGATLLHEEIYNFWPQAFQLKHIAPPPGITYRALGDASHVLAALLAGDAIALLPTELTRGLRRIGALVSPFDADIEPDAAYGMFVADLGTENPSLDRLMTWLTTNL